MQGTGYNYYYYVIVFTWHCNHKNRVNILKHLKLPFEEASSIRHKHNVMLLSHNTSIIDIRYRLASDRLVWCQTASTSFTVYTLHAHQLYIYTYRIAGNFGEVFNLAILREIANIISHTITLCGRSPNLMLAKVSRYTVCCITGK